MTVSFLSLSVIVPLSLLQLANFKRMVTKGVRESGKDLMKSFMYGNGRGPLCE